MRPPTLEFSCSLFILDDYHLECHPHCSQGDVHLQHVFSCELDEKKRSLLMRQSPQVAHVFSNVQDFSNEKGYCFVCGLVDHKKRNT